MHAANIHGPVTEERRVRSMTWTESIMGQSPLIGRESQPIHNVLLRQNSTNLYEWVCLPLYQGNILSFCILDYSVTRHVVIGNNLVIHLVLWTDDGTVEDIWFERSEIIRDSVRRSRWIWKCTKN